MRVLLVHNYTGKYAKGGEGNVFEDEADLLRAHGHDVRQYKCTNAEIMEGSLLQKLRAFINAPWSQYGYRVIREQIEEFKPDIIHIHNFFFILSPSVFRAAKDAGVPVVVTLHNYRFICPCSQLLRNGRICELCINKNPWRIMLYRCYRNSFWASLFRYLVYYLSKKKYGWLDDIDGFIALTEFAKHKYVQAGLPGERIYVKPNFIADPLSNNSFSENQKEYGLFAGRISPEKGLDNLLQAWQDFEYPLRVLGDGPAFENVKKYESKKIRFLGMVSRERVLKELAYSSFLLFPSICYEGFPCSMIEAMAMGKPVVASRLGARAEIIEDGKTGLLFESGNSADLLEKTQRLIDEPGLAVRMGRAAREEYLNKYTPDRNYEMLLGIYEVVINKASTRRN